MLVRAAIQAKRKTFAPFLLCLLLASQSWSANWLWQHPVPQGNTIRAAASAEDFLISAGDYGTIVRLDLKTRKWQPVATPTQQHLRAVAFVSGGDWVVVGFGGTILRSSDSGLTWAPQESGVREDIYGLAFGGSDLGIAVGSGGTILRSEDGGRSWARSPIELSAKLRAVTVLSSHEAVVVGESGAVLKTDDGGMNWKQQELSGNLYAIASRGDELIAVGGKPRYFRNRREVFHSTDRGNNWKEDLSESGPVLYGVSIGTDGTAVACGESGTLLRMSGDGSGWVRMSRPTKALLTAVIHAPEDVLAFGSFGIVLTSSDNGQKWTANFHEKQKGLNSISFADASHGVAVGGEGLILYTTDGGDTWQVSKPGLKAGFSAVSMLSPAVAVAVGPEGMVIRSEDGGATWESIPLGMDIYLYAMDFADETSGLAVGYSTIMATADGGRTWKRRPIPKGVGDTLFFDVSYANKSTAAIVGTLGVVLTTADGGQTWSRPQSGTTQHLRSLTWSDPQHAVAVGIKGTILRTSNGGRTWATVQSGTDQMLTGVAFVNDREGFACGLGGILLATKDGGNSWTPAQSPTSNHLSRLFSRPGGSVFAVGWNATILRRAPSEQVAEQ
jgi:photosystem II stability/assembly factor-like uncharacterized protein